MPDRPARAIAFIEHHLRYWPDPELAAGELRAALGDEADVFLLLDADGGWSAACAPAPPTFRARRWIETRTLPAGEYRVSELEGLRAERLVRRADGRPPTLARAEEAPTGEGEYEPGGETFGLSTLLGAHAGLRRIGVNVDVVRPGERSTRYHWHHDEEECFLVLSGSGLVQVGGRTFRVGPGDFLAKPEGAEHAHQFVNDGERDLRILTIGERRRDEIEYPPAPWEPGAPFPTPES